MPTFLLTIENVPTYQRQQGAVKHVHEEQLSMFLHDASVAVNACATKGVFRDDDGAIVGSWELIDNMTDR